MGLSPNMPPSQSTFKAPLSYKLGYPEELFDSNVWLHMHSEASNPYPNWEARFDQPTTQPSSLFSLPNVFDQVREGLSFKSPREYAMMVCFGYLDHFSRKTCPLQADDHGEIQKNLHGEKFMVFEKGTILTLRLRVSDHCLKTSSISFDMLMKRRIKRITLRSTATFLFWLIFDLLNMLSLHRHNQSVS